MLFARATVQEKDTMGPVVSVWALTTWWAGEGARWTVARAMVKIIKDAAAVVVALDPVVGHRSR